jgi:hypothetical protein
MTSKLQLDTLELDLQDYAIQKNLFIGIAESGKSQSAGVMVERLMENLCPVTIYDPVGIWKNLKISNGTPTGKAYPIVVVGHGGDISIDLDAEKIKEITRFMLRKHLSVVFDISDVDREKWGEIVASSVKVIFTENELYGIRHLFFDEAAEFAPQSMKMIIEIYNEVERTARIGGNRKIGMTFVNNLPESLHKNITKLCEGLFLHRQAKDESSLKKLNKWLNAGSITNKKEIVTSLGTLNPGQCWVWTRESSNPTLVQMPRKNSYHPNRRDSSITIEDLPTMDDLPSLISEMKAVTEEIVTVSRIPFRYFQTELIEPTPPQPIEISTDIDWDSITDNQKDRDYRIYQKAHGERFASTTVVEYVNSMIKNGYTEYETFGYRQAWLKSKTNVHPRTLDYGIQQDYAEMLIRRLGKI